MLRDLNSSIQAEELSPFLYQNREQIVVLRPWPHCSSLQCLPMQLQGACYLPLSFFGLLQVRKRAEPKDLVGLEVVTHVMRNTIPAV